MNLFTLYLILTVLPNLNSAFIILTIAASLAVIHVFLLEDEDRSKIIKPVIATLCFLILSVMTPTAKQIAYLVSGYAITNTENIDKLPKNLVDAANKYLESYTSTQKELDNTNKTQP